MPKVVRILTQMLLIVIPVWVQAQPLISGRITERSGAPIPGVNVYVRGTWQGGTTDTAGYFAFTAQPADTAMLCASAVGYKLVCIPVEGKSNFSLVLEPAVNELSAVTITSGAVEVSDRASAVVLKPLDIVTTAGAVGDVSAALTTLPGAATVANDGRLFVRGGDASETGIYFDGQRVANAYGTSAANIPTRNRFSPQLFKGTFFSTGGFSAEYGEALSSVLALETVDMPVRNQTDLSLMSVGGGISSTFTNQRQALTLQGNYTNLGPYQSLINQFYSWDIAPRGIDGQLVYRHKIGERTMIRAFVMASQNELALFQPTPGVEAPETFFAVKNRFGFGTVSFRTQVSDKLVLEGGGSSSLNRDELGLDSLEFRADNRLLYGRQKLTWYLSDAFKLRVGAEMFSEWQRDTDMNLSAARQTNRFNAAPFAEGEWFASRRLTLRQGFRLNTELHQHSIEWRSAAAWALNERTTLSAAAGTFRQPHELRARFGNFSGYARATHVQGGIQFADSDRVVRAEVYQKWYQNLQLANSISGGGAGMANGAEIFYRDRKSVKNLDYWITYSYIHSRRNLQSLHEQVQPGFAPTHNFNVVVKWWLRKLNSQVGATYAYNSGYTYDNPALPGERESVSPAFSQLSINWSYLPRENIIIHLACNNVLGRENIVGYRFAPQPDDDGTFASVPIGQPALRFLFVGLFITLSADKSANQLNNL